MKRLAISAFAAAALLSAPAIAADVPVKGPVYKAIPYYNWTGWYGGINAGYGWDPNYIISTPGEADINLGLQPSGPFGGLQFGYNWHYARNYLVGIEIDFQFADIRDSVIFTAGGGGANASVASIQIQNFGTIRGRWGYVDDRTLYFVTAGAAFANFDVHIRAQYDANVGTINGNQWEVGYVVGAGIERAFMNNWTARIEYLFMDFSLDMTGVASNAAYFTLRGDPQLHALRIALNYRFGSRP
jgi:outer membrane immunogenic protein